MKHLLKMIVPVATLMMAGCQAYKWTSDVPEEMRTIAVPTFRNESTVTELGTIVSRQILRELQREGTFRLAPVGEAAVEVQGVIKSGGSRTVAYSRQSGIRNREHEYRATAIVSFIDKKSGRVLVNDRRYSARTTFLSSHDTMTGERDASGRLAEDLARQITDDLLSFNWKRSASHE